jgi:hypothetical protein
MKEMNMKAVEQTEQELIFTRILRAPRALVFTMFAKPEHLTQWGGRQIGRFPSVPSTSVQVESGISACDQLRARRRYGSKPSIVKSSSQNGSSLPRTLPMRKAMWLMTCQSDSSRLRSLNRAARRSSPSVFTMHRQKTSRQFWQIG